MNSRVFAFVLFLLLAHTASQAQVPQLLNYQGRIVVGNENFDGNGQFKFALVNATGSQTFWSNDGSSTAGSEPTYAVTLSVVKGIYSVQLGNTTLPNMTVLPSAVFRNSGVWLRVWFNDGVHGSQLLKPDQQFAAVGYAMMAGNVPDGAITSAKIAAGAIRSAQLASNLNISGTVAAAALTGDGSNLTNLNAASVKFTPAGAGAVTTNLDAINKARPINAKTDFGAVGDDVADDTSKLQAALDAGKAQLKPVYIPAGTYRLTQALTEYWNGMTIYGDGKVSTVLKQYTANQNGLSVPQNPDDRLFIHDLRIIYAGAGLSTGVGLYLNGNKDYTGTPGAGNNIDETLIQNLYINNFDTAIDCFGVANTVFLNCSGDVANTASVYTHGNSNAVTFLCCAWGASTPGSVGYHLSGALCVEVSGGEMNLGGTGTRAFVCDGAQVNMTNVHMEANSDLIPVVVSAGSLIASGCAIGQYGGTWPYPIQVLNGAGLSLNGFGGQTVRVDWDGTSHNVSASSGQTMADIYTGGKKTNRYMIGPGVLSTTHPGLYLDIGPAAGNVQGAIEWDKGSGGGSRYTFLRPSEAALDTFSLYSSRNQDGSSPTFGFTWDETSNIFTFLGAINAQGGFFLNGAALAGLGTQTFTGSETFNDNLVWNANPAKWLTLAGNLHGANGNSLSGGIAFAPSSGGRNWMLGNGDFADDFGLFASTAVSSGANSYQSGSTNPSSPIFYVDATNNRTSIGHLAATKPPGTGTLNAEGSFFAKSVGGSTFGGTASSVTAGIGSGAGGVASLDANANDVSGTLTVATGSNPTVSAVICTVTFGTSKNTPPHIVISPANAAAADLAKLPYTSATTTNFSFNSGATATLAPSTTYSWNYVVLQ